MSTNRLWEMQEYVHVKCNPRNIPSIEAGVMEIIKKLWKYRLLIVVALLGSWLWYENNEDDKRKKAEEVRIAAQAEERRVREQTLFSEYENRKNKIKCGISYEVTLETYGATVNVELRVGAVGKSFPLVVKQAKDGKLNYTNLCPGSYFLAIGDEKNVSTTPVQDFVTGKNYTSKVHMTKGVGNMKSARRDLL
jgi:hypothetical protein